MIDSTCNRGCAETVVDVHDRNARRAAVEHAEQSGEPAKARTITDAGGYRDHRNLHEPADDAWQSALHPCNDDHHAGRGKALTLCQEPMDARDAHVEKTIDAVAHHFCGHTRFFGNGQVGCARRRDEDGATTGLYVCLTVRDSTSDRLKHGSRNFFLNCGEGGLSCPRHEQSMASRHDLRGDRGDMVRRFTQPEDDLSRPPPTRTT